MKLKECPFCQNIDKVKLICKMKLPKVYVLCERCDSQGPSYWWGIPYAKQKATISWNDRSWNTSLQQARAIGWENRMLKRALDGKLLHGNKYVKKCCAKCRASLFLPECYNFCAKCWIENEKLNEESLDRIVWNDWELDGEKINN